MMSIIFKQAFRGLLAAPIRSFLTILGVIIGISSVVMFMALGEGLRRDISNEITKLGSNLIIVVPGQYGGNQQFNYNLISGDILQVEDFDRLRHLASVEKASPLMLVGGTIKHHDRVSANVILFGSGPDFLDVFLTITIANGRFFTSDENQSKERVIILGSTIAHELFGNDDPIGQTVTLSKTELRVIGVTKTPEQASIFGGQDYGVMSAMPIETAGDLTGGVKIVRILLAVKPDLLVKDQVELVRQILLERHAPEDFTVLTQGDVLKTLDGILNLLTSVIIAIAAISLIVAGVGIMNIMLVAVTERTREIGLKKAIGARNSSILLQFLIEAMILTILGAVIALLLSILATRLITAYTPIHPIVTMTAIIWAVGISVSVGIIFGLAPAIRAAKLDPITALRYE